jgi:GNAT superfamily N-acetyltransferase
MKKLIKFNEFIKEEFNVGKIEISNISQYLNNMSKGISDKLFFFNNIDVDCIVDFGSADGTILNTINTINPNIKLIGYDIDEKMIDISKKKYPNINFFDNWSSVENYLKINKFNNPMLLLSSVIHEVYSYSDSKTIKYFWDNQVFNKLFKYIVIRDMIPSIDYEKMNIIELEKIRNKSNKKYLQEFENYWGSINKDFRTLLHWLLKYKYVDNWNRELKENYLPLTIETLKNKIKANWKIIYEKHYIYDYIKKQIKDDFDLELKESTHLKMIIENTRFNNEIIDKETIDNFLNNIKNTYKYLYLKYSIYDVDNKPYIFIREIKIKDKFKNKGYGTFIMNLILNYCKENNIIISLTPSDVLGSDLDRLINFYKKLGFVENINNDYDGDLIFNQS